MKVTSLGLVTDTAGAATPLSATTVLVAKIAFRARNANTTPVNVGVVGFTPGGAGQIGEVLKPAGGYSDTLEIEAEGNELDLAQYAVKPVTNGEGVYVAYWKR